MDKLKKSFYIYKKPENYIEDFRFIFSNLEKNKVIFQTTLVDYDDYASVNFEVLDSHYNYGYKFQIYKNGKWNKFDTYNRIVPIHHSEEYKINYSFYERRDSNKLLIVFIGDYNHKSAEKYSWLGSLNVNKLFLYDQKIDNEFIGHYIGDFEERDLEKRVLSLINDTLNYLSLTKEDTVLIGENNGGFAALYYLFKHKFKKAIVSSPNIYLGDYYNLLEPGLETVDKFMGNREESSIDKMNNLLFNEVTNDNSSEIILYNASSSVNSEETDPTIRDEDRNVEVSNLVTLNFINRLKEKEFTNFIVIDEGSNIQNDPIDYNSFLKTRLEEML